MNLIILIKNLTPIKNLINQKLALLLQIKTKIKQIVVEKKTLTIVEIFSNKEVSCIVNLLLIPD
jgi:hypothetical protein